ncbi:MAG TPA: hypothetical protein VFX35_03155 [Solirubrobacterales bacterium]|nr:hypothetical protein [Solirubrobacterales bacterium]
MAKFFGFVQFDFAGTLPLADGRYLAGSPEGDDETVLVLQRLGAPAIAERRRRRGRSAPADPEPAPVALTRATVIRAASPFEGPAEAARWLDEACESEETVEELAVEAIATLNRALHAQAVAAADPHGRQLAPEQAERVLLGHGSGEETADGRFTDARQVDLTPRTASRRRKREEELRPQERVAAILRGREHLDACETLLLRARADHDAGRDREAALQLRIGLEALLVELDGAMDDPDHEKDMATLREHQAAEQPPPTEETLAVCERVLRRRRVLRG